MELYQFRKHEREVNNFLRSVNLKQHDLQHPCFDDLKLLQEIKRNVWSWLSSKEKDKWYYYWIIVYKDKKRLNRKAIRFLTRTMENVIYKQEHRLQQANKIKKLRHSR